MKIYLIVWAASSWVATAIAFFRRLGAFGFFLLEALDTSFLYLPLANELLMVALLPSNDSVFMWALYVLMAALGSVAGAALVDLPMRRAGEKGLEKFVRPRRIKWLKARLVKNGWWPLFLSGMMPPPFPFRAVLFTASALQSPRRQLLTAIFFGRLVRFSVEAALVLTFGRGLLRFLDSNLFQYVVYGLVVAGLVGSALTLSKWLTGRGGRARVRARGAAG